jgi:hypothetical protein
VLGFELDCQCLHSLSDPRFSQHIHAYGYCTMPPTTLVYPVRTCRSREGSLVVRGLVLHGRVARVVLVLLSYSWLAYGQGNAHVCAGSFSLTCCHGVCGRVDTVENDEA